MAHQGKLRDCAGIVFRMYGFVAECALESNAESAELISVAIEAIIQPFESDAERVDIGGPHLGGLYTQALVAAGCGNFSGLPVAHTQAAAKRLGEAIVKWYLEKPDDKVKKEFQKHITEDYMVMTHDTVWGGADNDVVWKTLMDKPLPGMDEASLFLFEENVQSIEAMGFVNEVARNALKASNGSLEAAIEKLLIQGMEPFAGDSAGLAVMPVEEADNLVEQLVLMGFEQDLARDALEGCGFQLDAALEHLFIHA